MEERVLARTGLTVSALGLGAAGIGGLYREFESDEQAAEVVRAAFEAGITYGRPSAGVLDGRGPGVGGGAPSGATLTSL
jgi:hypothetical protein